MEYRRFLFNALSNMLKDVIGYHSVHSVAGSGSVHVEIFFALHHPCVTISDSLRAALVTTHTNGIVRIVLENYFRNLVAHDNHFSVILSFNSKEEELLIPYGAVLTYTDLIHEFSFVLQCYKSKSENKDLTEATIMLTSKQPDESSEETKPDSQEDEGEIPDNVVFLSKK